VNFNRFQKIEGLTSYNEERILNSPWYPKLKTYCEANAVTKVQQSTDRRARIYLNNGEAHLVPIGVVKYFQQKGILTIKFTKL
jgi:hypothetical protein